MSNLLEKLKLGMRTPSRITFAGASHPGNVRDHNEDAFGIDSVHGVAIVADGVGGLDYGEVASRMVVDLVLSAVAEGRSITDGLQFAHKKITQLITEKPGVKMATTVVAAAFMDGKAVIEWAGDSRAYLWRCNRLEQITKDHSFVQQLVDYGAIAPADAEQHPNRNVVTRAIGQDSVDLVEIDQLQLPLQDGDRLLLCTDGLNGYLSSGQISEELRRGGSDLQVAQRLIMSTLANSEAGDNVTVVCASVSK